MPREFSSASSQALTRSNAVISAYPFTVAAWARATTVASLQEVISIGANTGANQNEVSIGFSATGAPRARVATAGTERIATAGAAPSNGAWCHICGVFTNSTSRDCYLNAANKGSNTSSVNLSGSLDRMALGRRELDTPSNYLTGAIAEAAIWSVALDIDEITALAKGVCPLLIRPTALLAYWPLFGNDSPEPDRWRNSYALTLVNTPTKSTDGIRVYYPQGSTQGS